MNNLNEKLSQIIYAEIYKTYHLEGSIAKADSSLIKMQAEAISNEICKHYTRVGSQELTMCLPLCRKLHGKITYNTIVKTFESRDWQIELNEFHLAKQKQYAFKRSVS